MKFEILVFEGVDEMDSLAPYEVLQRAAGAGALVEAQLVGHEEVQEVTTAHGVTIGCQGSLAADGPPDVVVVPGGGWNASPSRGVRVAVASGDLPEAIARLHRQGAIVACVCTGAMVAATAGLTKDRPANTHHGAIEDLEASGAIVTNTRVVDDGDLVTAGGVTSGLELSLWLVERFFGPSMSLGIEAAMEYQRRGTVWSWHKGAAQATADEG